MSKQFTKFILKAKNKLCKKLKLDICIKPNESSTNTDYSSYLSVTIVDYPKTVSENVIQSTRFLKKQTAQSNLVINYQSRDKPIEESFFNINELPFLVATPELRLKNAKSKIDTNSTHDISSFEESLLEDLLLEETDDLNTAVCEQEESQEVNDDTLELLNEMCEYENFDSESNFSQMYPDSFGFKSNDFQSINSQLFKNDISKNFN